MLTGYFSNISGMYYNEQKLGNVANNLANVDTTGFRRSMMMFRTREENDETKWVDGQVKERLPSTHGIERSGVFQDYKKTGDMRQTGSPMDLAIPSELSNAFFAVRRSDPTDQTVYYTRNGTLSMGPSQPGVPDSPPALYIAGHMAIGEDGAPIEVDASAGPLNISTDGEVYQGDARIGTLPVYSLNKSPDPGIKTSADLQRLQQMGDSLFKIPEQFQAEFHPQQLKVGESGITRLTLQGVQEASNVNPFSELMEMMNSTKAFEANTKAIRQQVDSLTKLFQLVRR